MTRPTDSRLCGTHLKKTDSSRLIMQKAGTSIRLSGTYKDWLRGSDLN
jgi:hypothetical protein